MGIYYVFLLVIIFGILLASRGKEKNAQFSYLITTQCQSVVKAPIMRNQYFRESKVMLIITVIDGLFSKRKLFGGSKC